MEKQNLLAVSIAAFVLIIVASVSKGLVHYWNSSVAEMSYNLQSVTMMDLCENKYSSRDSLMKELKVDEDGKQFDAYTFTCTYRSYNR